LDVSPDIVAGGSAPVRSHVTGIIQFLVD